MRLDMTMKKVWIHSIFQYLSKATNYCRPHMRAANSLIGVSLSGARVGLRYGKIIHLVVDQQLLF